MESNAFGQPLGEPVPNWAPRAHPTSEPMIGESCRLERLTLAHTSALFAANSLDTDGRTWTYLPYGPFATEPEYATWVEWAASSVDPMFWAIISTPSRDKPERAAGVASYLRIFGEAGSIEVGHLHFSPLLQRSRAATEAMFLMASRVFDDLGYRRYEWKCNADNQPSMAAAERLGFTFEGTHRQATVVKGRNRNTAWFSMLHREWPLLKAGFQAWLDPNNVGEDGQQLRSLAEVRGDLID